MSSPEYTYLEDERGYQIFVDGGPEILSAQEVCQRLNILEDELAKYREYGTKDELAQHDRLLRFRNLGRYSHPG